MTTRSTRLAGPYAVASLGWEDFFTVPTGATAIVKSVRVVNRTAAPLVFDIVENVTDDEHAFFWQETLPAGAIVLDSSWWVMEADSVLYVRSSVADAIAVWSSGALLPA